MRAEEKGTTKERVEAMQKKFDVSLFLYIISHSHYAVPPPSLPLPKTGYVL